MARVKVLYLSQATGGVKRHVTFLAEHLDRNRFEVVGCFSPVDHVRGVDPTKESYFDAFGRLGLRVVPLEMYREIRPLQDLRTLLGLCRILKQEKCDILHTHSSKAGFLGRVAGRLTGIPVIVHTPHAFAFDIPPHSPFNFFYRFLEKIAGYFCDALITLSPSEEELARASGVVSREKIVQIRNGIDVKEFEVTLDPRAKKEALGITGGRPVVLTIGRFAPQKAPGIFIEATKKVLARNPEVCFVMVGDGPLLEKVRRSVEQQRLKESVFLLGWRSDVKEILACCDIYVLASLWEGLPYTVLEAMALRKPVVATAARGTRDVVRDGVNGYLVSLRDSDAMAERILELLSDRDRARRFGESGRSLVEKAFTLKPQIQETEALYRRLLSAKAPPG